VDKNIQHTLAQVFVNSYIGCPLEESVDAYIPERVKIYTRSNALAQVPRSYKDDFGCKLSLNPADLLSLRFSTQAVILGARWL
jgi:hypothetical protein